MAVERVLSNLNLISFKTEGGLQNHIDELQDGDLVFTPDSSLKGNLFDFKWTDHKLNDISWLNADTFSWQSGDVYEAAYNHLAEDCKVYAWQYAPTQGGDIGYTTTETPAVGGVLMIGSNACDITEVGSDYVVAEHYKTGEARTYQRVADSDSTAFVAGVLSTETVSGVTISFYRAEDGHKIVGADQEANIANLYEATGVAWYYILDRENKRFKLPRTKFGFTGLRDSVGGYVKAGLPNITGKLYPLVSNSAGVSDWATKTGVFKKSSGATAGAAAQGNVYAYRSAEFDASDSSPVYGNSNTVQPEATQMYLYFYVGNFERGAVEQTAGITSEMFNNKADVSTVESLRNAENFTATGKATLSGFGMPSSKTLGFSLGESGLAYTMPADGYLQVTADSVDAKGNIVIANNTTSINTSTTATYSGFTMYAVAPVRKGDVVNVWFNYSTLKRVRFNYAEGSK